MHQESLDKRERKFVAGVAAGKPLRQAAKDAGYATSTAEKKAYKILRAPREQSFLTNSLEQAGITRRRSLHPMVDALQARRRVAINGPDGGIELETEFPDHRMRLDAFDGAERL